MSYIYSRSLTFDSTYIYTKLLPIASYNNGSIFNQLGSWVRSYVMLHYNYTAVSYTAICSRRQKGNQTYSYVASYPVPVPAT